MLVRRYMTDPVRHEVVADDEDRRRHDAPLPPRARARPHQGARRDRRRRVAHDGVRAHQARRRPTRLAAQARRRGRRRDPRRPAPVRTRAGAARTSRADSHAVLVATDVAARGIHVDDVDVVVHFDPPEEHKGYTHRSGRTARAGREGVVVTFVLWNQELDVEKLQRRLGMREPIIEVFSNDPRLADLVTLDVARAAAQAGAGARPRRQNRRRRERRLVRSGMSATDWSVPIGGEAVTTGEWIEVRSPYDDALLGRVPTCGAGAGRRRGRSRQGRARRRTAARVEARRDPRPPPGADRRRAHRGARAASSPTEAAKPIKTARVEAQRAVSTFTFAAVAARTLAGEVVPMDASAAGEGKLAFTLRHADRRRRRDQPVQLPAQPRRAQARARDRRRLPGGAEAGEPDARCRRSRSRAILLDECGLPAGHLNVVTGGGGTVGNAIVDHPDIALITFTGSPDVGWGIKAPRAAQEGRPRARQQRAADHRTERRRRDRRARRCRSRASRHAGPVVHLDAAHLRARVGARARSSTRSCRSSKGSSSAIPLDETTDVSALISNGERDRVQSWVDEAVAGGRRDPRRRQGARRRRARADGARRRHARHEGVRRRGVRSGRRRRDVHRARRGARGSPTTPATASRPRSSPPTSATRCSAARTLDYGGVLVNEVPTFRADQQPYGGYRDSGNTREGPAMGGAGDDRGAPGRHPALIPGGVTGILPRRQPPLVPVSPTMDRARTRKAVAEPEAGNAGRRDPRRRRPRNAR